MAIVFRCACGKGLKCDDKHAGKRTKCIACGRQLIVPAFVPNASPVRVNTAPRPKPPRKRRDIIDVISSVGAGLVVAAVLLAVAWAALQPKAQNAPPVVAAPVAVPDPPAGANPGGPAWLSSINYEDLVAALMALGWLALFVPVPLVAPAIMSRFKLLSMARWVILACFFLFLAVVDVVLCISLLASSEGGQYVNTGNGGMRFRKNVELVAVPMSLCAIPLTCATAGCLLAAAIYPKSPTP